MLHAITPPVIRSNGSLRLVNARIQPRFGVTPPPPPPPPARLTVWQFLGKLFRGRYDRDLGTVVKVGALALLSAFIGFAASGRLSSVEEPPSSSHHASHDPHPGGHDTHHGDNHGGAHAPGAHDAGGHGNNAGHNNNHGHHDMNAELDNFLRRKKQQLEHDSGNFDPFYP